MEGKQSSKTFQDTSFEDICGWVVGGCVDFEHSLSLSLENHPTKGRYISVDRHRRLCRKRRRACRRGGCHDPGNLDDRMVVGNGGRGGGDGCLWMTTGVVFSMVTSRGRVRVGMMLLSHEISAIPNQTNTSIHGGEKCIKYNKTKIAVCKILRLWFDFSTSNGEPEGFASSYLLALLI
jgi:hypothetical protein